MSKTPKGMRLHIGILGRRNVGKSSLLNAIARQDVAIVSPEPGTTTDPVEKSMEMLPLGPVVLIDTAGLDDVGALGEQRVGKARRVLRRLDVALLVAEAADWGDGEDRLLAELEAAGIPVIAVLNKVDLAPPPPGLAERLAGRGVIAIPLSAGHGEGADAVRDALIRTVPEEFLATPTILGDLVPAGELAMLVVPIDLEAPRGRLILPQVQAIRDLLDHDACCLVAKESGLSGALARLKSPPALVVTDSQAFAEVAAAVPPAVPLTSFSILFARFKGDLPAMVEGALAIDRLRPGDRVLVAEACSHHPVGEDIGRVKIPRWLSEYVGGRLDFTTVQGQDYPEDLSPFRLVIHCGACTFNRRNLLARIFACRRAGVPITNYGVAIAFALGIFERALAPFPDAVAVLRAHGRPPAAG